MATLKYNTSLYMSSTVGSAYTAGETSIVVATDEGSKFPSSGDFWVRINNAAGTIKKCTARTGDTLTVPAAAADGTTDQNATVGVAVDWIIGPTALDELRADQNRVLTAAEFNALTSSDYKQGDRILISDGFYEAIRGSSSWNYKYGPHWIVPPLTSGWSWVNQGTATISQSNDGLLLLTVPDNAAVNWRMYQRTVSSAPYTLTVKFFLFIRAAAYLFSDSQAIGVYLRESSSGKLIGLEFIIQASSCIIRVERMTDPNTDFSTPASSAQLIQQFTPDRNSLLILKIQNDNTNHIYSYSLNEGISFTTLLTEAKGAYITPDYFGIGGISVISNAVGSIAGRYISWEVT